MLYPPHTPVNMFYVSCILLLSSLTVACFKRWMTTGSTVHSCTVHSCTPVVIFLASSRFFLWDRGVTARTLGCVVNERFYPGCYSFISAQWGKRQHLYLLNLIWKRHTGGLSTQKKSIFSR